MIINNRWAHRLSSHVFTTWGVQFQWIKWIYFSPWQGYMAYIPSFTAYNTSFTGKIYQTSPQPTNQPRLSHLLPAVGCPCRCLKRPRVYHPRRINSQAPRPLVRFKYMKGSLGIFVKRIITLGIIVNMYVYIYIYIYMLIYVDIC